MDGPAATQHIRTSQRAGALPPFPVVAAFSGAAQRDECLRAGMDGFLNKPIAVETLADEIQRLLPSRAVMQCRRQLTEMQTSEKLRRRQSHAASLASVERVLGFLAQDLADNGAQISAHLDRHHAELAAALATVPGVGQTSVAVLIAELPELGKIDRKRIAALVSVAPINPDSSQMRGQRSIWGGRHDVRRTLYMATLVAVRFCASFRVFYERLLANGKAKKVALVASMRKLLATLNSMAKHGSRWNPMMHDT